MDVLYGISKLQFLIKKRFLRNISVVFPYPDSLEMLDPDSLNPDLQHWFLGSRAGNTSKTTLQMVLLKKAEILRKLLSLEIRK
jgi:hypothetical protein